MQNTNIQNSVIQIKAKPMWATVDKVTNEVYGVYSTREAARDRKYGGLRIVKVALQPLAFVR